MRWESTICPRRGLIVTALFSISASDANCLRRSFPLFLTTTQVGAPNADPQDVDSAGTVYVVFGSESSGEDHTWGSTIDVSSLDGSDGFVMTGSTANGHFGCVSGRRELTYNISLSYVCLCFPRRYYTGERNPGYRLLHACITRREYHECSSTGGLM